MAKGYWIVRGEVTDPEAYKAYVAANAKASINSGRAFWCAPANTRSSRVKAALATW